LESGGDYYENLCNNTYYRSRLPIRHSKEWKKELKLSLQTSDMKKAVVTCKLISEKVKSLLEQGAFEMVV